MENEIVKFDYFQLTVENTEFIKQKETAIKARTAQTIIENGRDLMEVKERLEHGQFMSWCKVNFPWSRQTIQNMMNVADKLPNFGNLDISNSVLYLLSAPSVPESARIEAIEKAESGEKITTKETKALIEAHKQIQQQTNQINDLRNEMDELQSKIESSEITDTKTETDKLKVEMMELESKMYQMRADHKLELDNLKNQKPKEVEKIPEDYEKIKIENAKLKDEKSKIFESFNKKAKEISELKREIEDFNINQDLKESHKRELEFILKSLEKAIIRINADIDSGIIKDSSELKDIINKVADVSFSFCENSNDIIDIKGV